MLAGVDEGMPPVERHAWLELDERVWRERGRTGTSNVPGMRQDRLVEELPSEEDRREAVALAERYVEVLWPRRIEGDACRLLPQFDRDPDPYAADLTPR